METGDESRYPLRRLVVGFNPAASCIHGLKTASKHTAGACVHGPGIEFRFRWSIAYTARALELPAVRVSRGPLVIYCHPIRLLPGALLEAARGKDELVREHGLGKKEAVVRKRKNRREDEPSHPRGAEKAL